jgi:hypothetical protein
MAIYGPSNLPTSSADVPVSKPASGNSTEICPANAARVPGGYVVNTSAKPMWVGWGVPATAAQPSTQVPAGGAIDIPSSFVGAINGIWTAAGANGSVVHEFSA